MTVVPVLVRFEGYAVVDADPDDDECVRASLTLEHSAWELAEVIDWQPYKETHASEA